MRLVAEQDTRTTFSGVRRMTAWLRTQGYAVNRKLIRRLLSQIRLETISSQARTTQAHADHRVYPYLLRGMAITRSNQDWSTDISYMRLHAGCGSGVAMMD